MKLLSRDFKKGIKVIVETKEDIWHISHIIEKGDLISGRTERKIKIGQGEERKTKISRKNIFLKIEVEKIEFSKYSNELRVLGKIISESNDVAKGSYHSFEINEQTQITIEKTNWPNYQKKRLIESTKRDEQKIVIVILERAEVSFAILKGYGYEKLSEFEGEIQKKRYDEKKENTFFSDVIKKIEEYDERMNPEKIIVASPAFYKEELVKKIKNDSLKKKIITATCSSSKNAIEEVLKRPELKDVLKESRVAKEELIVDELMQEISKGGKATYGFEHVKQAILTGAVFKLILTDKFIGERREKETYEEVDELLKDADKKQTEIYIISSENNAGKKLDGISGIGVILRYNLNY